MNKKLQLEVFQDYFNKIIFGYGSVNALENEVLKMNEKLEKAKQLNEQIEKLKFDLNINDDEIPF